MSAKDETKPRKKSEAEDVEPDVVAHGYVADEIGDEDPGRKRKRKRKISEEPTGDEFGRKRK